MVLLEDLCHRAIEPNTVAWAWFRTTFFVFLFFFSLLLALETCIRAIKVTGLKVKGPCDAPPEVVSNTMTSALPWRLSLTGFEADVVTHSAMLKLLDWQRALRWHHPKLVHITAKSCSLGRQWQRALDIAHEEKRGLMAYNAGITACVRGEQWQQALWMLYEALGNGLELNFITCSAALKACEVGSAWSAAQSLLRISIRPNVIMYNSAINALAKGSQWQEAVATMREMQVHSMEPDLLTYSSTASAFGEAMKWQDSLGLMVEVRQQQIPLDLVLSTCVLNTCSLAHRWQEALQLDRPQWDTAFASCMLRAFMEGSMWRNAMHNFFKRPKNHGLYTSLMAACGKQVQWRRVLLLLEHLLDGMEPALLPFSAAIAACGDAQQWRAALSLLSELKAKGIQLDAMAYSPAIASGDWHLALSLLEEMGQQSVQENLFALNAAIHACGNVQRWQVALLLFHRFDDVGIQRDLVSLNSALSACSSSVKATSGLLLWLEHSGLQGDAMTYGMVAGSEMGRSRPSFFSALELVSAQLVKAA